MMIQGKWFPQGSDLSEALSVRRAVFGRDQDPLDAEAQNVVVYQDDLPWLRAVSGGKTEPSGWEISASCRHTGA